MKLNVPSWFILACLAFGAGTPAPARAALDQDGMIRNARYCTQQFARLERMYGIPKNLLMAISSTESGRYNERAKMVLPWPWTINVDGKGYYFDSMHEAVTAARNAKLRGADNVDVGCMQISLKHHPDAFASLTDAFSPEKNVAYGAQFLRQKFSEERSWKKAIAAYHSKTPVYGQKYYANIIRNWRKVLSALGGGYDIAQPNVNVIDVSRSERSLAERRRVAGLFDESSSASGSTKSGIASMKIIKVTTRSDIRRSPEVLVVRPAAAKANVEVAQSTVATREGYDFVMDIGQKAEERRMTDIVKTSEPVSKPAEVQRVSSPKRGPNFIFVQ